MKFQSIAYLLSGNAHLYWILDLEGEVHSTWHLWTSGLQKSKGNASFEVGRASSRFRSGSENLIFFLGGCMFMNIYHHHKASDSAALK